MKKVLPIAAAALFALALVGCQSAKREMAQAKQNDAFAPDDDGRSYRRFAIAQQAAGARHDGMLYPYHFDGERLNSLGEQKLSMMLRDNDHAFPIVVYLAVPENASTKTREDAVATYMTELGLKDDQFRFESGANPNATSSAAQNLVRYGKTEDEAVAGSNPTSPVSPGYGTGGGPGDAAAPPTSK